MSSSADPALPSRKVAFLKEVRLFAMLDEKDLSRLSQDMRLKEYVKGETIFRQGDTSGESNTTPARSSSSICHGWFRSATAELRRMCTKGTGSHSYDD